MSLWRWFQRIGWLIKLNLFKQIKGQDQTLNKPSIVKRSVLILMNVDMGPIAVILLPSVSILKVHIRRIFKFLERAWGIERRSTSNFYWEYHVASLKFQTSATVEKDTWLITRHRSVLKMTPSKPIMAQFWQPTCQIWFVVMLMNVRMEHMGVMNMPLVTIKMVYINADVIARVWPTCRLLDLLEFVTSLSKRIYRYRFLLFRSWRVLGK